MRRYTVLLMVIFMLLQGITLLAQDEDAVEWTCDDGPNDIVNAAQAALDEEDYDTAWWLASHGEVVCIDNANKYDQATELRGEAGKDVDLKSEFVDLGEYKLDTFCIGEGSPTVIFETGLGGRSYSAWKDIQPAISTFTRTCRYDRLGNGLSDPVPSGEIRTTQDQVHDLIALLKIAEVEPPYVLVGHSIGGLNITLFVEQYPDWVEGIVLVDSSHPEQFERWSEADPTTEAPPESITTERFDVLTSFAQAVGIKDFGDIPLVVITAGKQSGEDPIWVELQEETVGYSINSRHIIAEESGHNVMADQPEVVIEAILWVLDEVWAAEEEAE